MSGREEDVYVYLRVGNKGGCGNQSSMCLLSTRNTCCMGVIFPGGGEVFLRVSPVTRKKYRHAEVWR